MGIVKQLGLFFIAVFASYTLLTNTPRNWQGDTTHTVFLYFAKQSSGLRNLSIYLAYFVHGIYRDHLEQN